VFGKVPLADVGVVALELFEKFVRGWEAAVWFVDTRDSVDDELVEPVVTDEVKEAGGELVEEGPSVVFN